MYSNPDAFGVPVGGITVAVGVTVTVGEGVITGTAAVSFTVGDTTAEVAAGVEVTWAEDEYAYTTPLCVTAYSVFPDTAGEVM